MNAETTTLPDGRDNNDTIRHAAPMGRRRRLLIAALIVVSTVGCDRVAKQIAQESLMFSPPVSLMNDLVRFEYAENTGAFLSLGADMHEDVRFIVLGVLVSVFLVALLVYMLRTRSLRGAELIALALIAGGGVGNLVDRMTMGYVVDFVSIGIDGLRTGIFNIADVAITTGMLLFLVVRLRSDVQARRSSTTEA